MKGIKTGGRQLGTPNKTTHALKEKLIKIIDDNLDDFQKYLDQLNDPIQKLQMLEKLFKYVLPLASKPIEIQEEVIKTVEVLFCESDIKISNCESEILV
jgi:hypothetical protein